MSHIARSLVRVIGSTSRIVVPRVVAIRPIMMNTTRSMATAAPAGGVQVSQNPAKKTISPLIYARDFIRFMKLIINIK